MIDIENDLYAIFGCSQEKPHKCSLCSKSFPTPGDLKSHMYVHSGSWPYKCHICARGFSKHTNLKNHLFLHTDIFLRKNRQNRLTVNDLSPNAAGPGDVTQLAAAFYYDSVSTKLVYVSVSQKYASRLSFEKGGYGLRIGTAMSGAERVGRFQERHKIATERSVDGADFASNSTAAAPVAIWSLISEYLLDLVQKICNLMSYMRGRHAMLPREKRAPVPFGSLNGAAGGSLGMRCGDGFYLATGRVTSHRPSRPRIFTAARQLRLNTPGSALVLCKSGGCSRVGRVSAAYGRRRRWARVCARA
ncbi:Zinc finger protein 710 [Eumeta japonica]|uniref:Zinc finger protein 710 n=1 Tax=Eumeta variegata TaxID=151549 RepID=A0A4C1U280_EUMVA|nr:Zinc finger protein 710 [Eumeta japonica]